MPVKPTVVKLLKKLQETTKDQYKKNSLEVIAQYQAQVLRADTAENIARMLTGPRGTAEAGVRKLGKMSGKPTMAGRLKGSGQPGRTKRTQEIQC